MLILAASAVQPASMFFYLGLVMMTAGADTCRGIPINEDGTRALIFQSLPAIEPNEDARAAAFDADFKLAKSYSQNRPKEFCKETREFIDMIGRDTLRRAGALN